MAAPRKSMGRRPKRAVKPPARTKTKTAKTNATMRKRVAPKRVKQVARNAAPRKAPRPASTPRPAKPSGGQGFQPPSMGVPQWDLFREIGNAIKRATGGK